MIHKVTDYEYHYIQWLEREKWEADGWEVCGYAGPLISIGNPSVFARRLIRRLTLRLNCRCPVCGKEVSRSFHGKIARHGHKMMATKKQTACGQYYFWGFVESQPPCAASGRTLQDYNRAGKSKLQFRNHEPIKV